MASVDELTESDHLNRYLVDGWVVQGDVGGTLGKPFRIHEREDERGITTLKGPETESY